MGEVAKGNWDFRNEKLYVLIFFIVCNLFANDFLNVRIVSRYLPTFAIMVAVNTPNKIAYVRIFNIAEPDSFDISGRKIRNYSKNKKGIFFLKEE